MEFSFTNEHDGSLVKQLLKRQGVSKNLLARVKFDGGEIFVNGREETAIAPLEVGDRVKIVVPDEKASSTLIPEDFPLDIIFEDKDYLVINKPAGYPSITGIKQPTGSLSNFVAAYIKRQNYSNQTVHIVTRLDRGTSGLMLFAKHKYAHALMQRGKGRESLKKRYYALVSADESNLSVDGTIHLPIGREEGSIIKRQVRLDGLGGLYETKDALTSYTVIQRKNGLQLLDVVLHTGRTHQIRVHFAHLGSPLIGDTLYGGNHELLDRQALHSHSLEFLHPFTHEKIQLESPLPTELQKLV